MQAMEGFARLSFYWVIHSHACTPALPALPRQSESVECLALSGDGRAMVSGGADKLVKVWGFDDGRHAPASACSACSAQCAPPWFSTHGRLPGRGRAG